MAERTRVSDRDSKFVNGRIVHKLIRTKDVPALGERPGKIIDTKEIIVPGRPELDVSKVLVLGELPLEKMTIVPTGEEYIPPAELQEQIDAEWTPKAARGWTPGPLVRINSIALAPDGEVTLATGRTNYKDFSGVSLKDLKEHGYNDMPNPYSTDVAIFLEGDPNDSNNMVICKIAGPTNDAQGRGALFGGNAHPEEDRVTLDSEAIDPYSPAIRELTEELGIKPEEMSELVNLGFTQQIIKDKMLGVVGMFAVRVNLTREELLARQREAENGNEGKAIFVNPHELSSQVIRSQDFDGMVPDARITMALARKWYLKTDEPKPHKVNYKEETRYGLPTDQARVIFTTDQL